MSLSVWKTCFPAARYHSIFHFHASDVHCIRKCIVPSPNVRPVPSRIRRTAQHVGLARSTSKWWQQWTGCDQYRNISICSAAAQNAPLAVTPAEEAKGTSQMPFFPALLLVGTTLSLACKEAPLVYENCTSNFWLWSIQGRVRQCCWM